MNHSHRHRYDFAKGSRELRAHKSQLKFSLLITAMVPGSSSFVVRLYACTGAQLYLLMDLANEKLHIAIQITSMRPTNLSTFWRDAEIF